MQWLAVAANSIFYILYPVFWLLTLLLSIVYWILSPLIYLGYLLKEVVLLPFRFLAKFEVSKSREKFPNTNTLSSLCGTS